MLSENEIIGLLQHTDKEENRKLYNRARESKHRLCGKNVYIRGLVEISNICQKDCYYCGIRKSNKNVQRYLMTEDEIVNSAKWAYDNGYASLVLQSGERIDENFIVFVENVLKKIQQFSNKGIHVTISFGEQTRETYKRWFEAGAHRYLLRIESSNKKLYEWLHPKSHTFENRVEALNNIKETGYQLGTGVMIGLPNQTYADLASDIKFFHDIDVDMVGMGPYLPHKDAPLPQGEYYLPTDKDELLELSLKMIAVTRICLPDINIASTTALQAIKSFGREQGILAGANVFMPNISDVIYRPNYQLYDNKPCIDDTSTECLECAGKRIEMIGEEIRYDVWGDSQHYLNKVKSGGK